MKRGVVMSETTGTLTRCEPTELALRVPEVAKALDVSGWLRDASGGHTIEVLVLAQHAAIVNFVVILPLAFSAELAADPGSAVVGSVVVAKASSAAAIPATEDRPESEESGYGQCGHPGHRRPDDRTYLAMTPARPRFALGVLSPAGGRPLDGGADAKHLSSRRDDDARD